MKQVYLFALAGGVGFVVDFLCFSGFAYIVNIHISRLLAFLVAVSVTYLLNKSLAFKGNRGSYFYYVAGQSAGIGINFLVFEAVLLSFDNKPFTIGVAFMAGSVVAMVFNFFFAKKVVFK